MKNYTFLLVLFLSFSLHTSAQNNVPFQLTKVHLKMPDDMPGLQVDSAHWHQNYYEYDYDGQQIKDTLAATLQAAKTTDRSTPWLTLQELLYVYQAGDLNGIKALYTKGSQAAIKGALSTTELENQFLAIVKQATFMRPYFAIEYDQGIIAFVESHPGFVERFRFEKTNGQYLLAAYSEKGAASVNNAYVYYLFKPKPHETPTLLKGVDSLSEDDSPPVSFKLKNPKDWLIIFEPKQGNPINLIAQDNGFNDNNSQLGQVDFYFSGSRFPVGTHEVAVVESNYPIYGGVSNLMIGPAIKFKVKVKNAKKQ